MKGETVPATLDIFKENQRHTFVETGSYIGDGVDLALKAGFKELHSIELSERYHEICLQRYRQQPWIQFYLGDSAKMLNYVIECIVRRDVLFWLDGHWCGEGTGIGDKISPIEEEIKHIKRSLNVGQYTILVDDINDNPEHILFKGNVEKIICDNIPELTIDYLCGDKGIEILRAK